MCEMAFSHMKVIKAAEYRAILSDENLEKRLRLIVGNYTNYTA